MELPQTEDFSAAATQRKFTEELQPMPSSPSLRAPRKRRLSIVEICSCQCKLGEVCRLATAGLPDICAGLAELAAQVNSSQGTRIYRINDSTKTSMARQRPTALGY